MAVDEARVEELVGQLAGHMTGAALCVAIWLGDELGYYRAMAGAGALGADALAKKAGCNPRLTREWLDGQAAAGFVAYDAANDTYALSDEWAMILADESAPTFMARGMNVIVSLAVDGDKLRAAYSGRWRAQLGRSSSVPLPRNGVVLPPRIPARSSPPRGFLRSTGWSERLHDGRPVADVGCGHGASVVVMASKYPSSTIHGFDFHPASIETAQERAKEAGVSDRTEFAVASAKEYPGTYDLICFFDCLHDMGDPVGIARYAREHLEPGGTVLLVEPMALDGRATNIAENPLAALLYTASSTVCTPNSLSQEVGLGLGAQAGEARLRQVFEEAGYSHFRRGTRRH